MSPAPDRLFAVPGSTLSNLGARFNIVVVAEGFSGPLERLAFAGLVTLFAARTRSEPPFDTYRETINILGLETDSAVSATGLKRACPPQALATRFAAVFCADGPAATKDSPERIVHGRGADVIAALEAQPALHGQAYHPLVLVNSPEQGGVAESASLKDGTRTVVKKIAWTSVAGDWIRRAWHELGHSTFNLADEYEYDNGPVAWSGGEPGEPNVTARVTKQDLAGSPDDRKKAWAGMMRPAVPLPSTEPKPDFKPRDSVAEEPLRLGVSTTDVGLFEGADHYPRGLYRPQADCRMRHDSARFCQVCDYTLRSELGSWHNLQEGRGLAAGPTTIVAFARNALDALIRYDGITGAHTVFGLSGAQMTSTVAAEAGWTSMIGVQLANRDRALFAHSFATGHRALLRLELDLNTGEANLKVHEDLGTGFDQPWTSLSSFELLGVTHILGYNRFTGEAALTRADPVTLKITEVASWRTAGQTWQTGWEHVIGVVNRGVPFVVRLSVHGPRDVQPLLPFGRRPDDWAVSIAPDKLAGIGFTHATAYATEDGAYLIRYAAFSGLTLVESLRPHGESFDVVARLRLPPNALSLFGAGAPVLTSAPTFGRITIGFAHAPTGSLRVYGGGANAAA